MLDEACANIDSICYLENILKVYYGGLRSAFAYVSQENKENLIY